MFFTRLNPIKQPSSNPYIISNTPTPPQPAVPHTIKQLPTPATVYSLYNSLQVNPPITQQTLAQSPILQNQVISSGIHQTPDPKTIPYPQSPSNPGPSPPPSFQRPTPFTVDPQASKPQFPVSIRPRVLFPDDVSPTSPTQPQELDSYIPPQSISAQYRKLFNYHHKYTHCRYHQPDRVEAKLSTTNFKANFPWGDNLSSDKDPNTFRQYYQNINGIKLDDRGGDLASFLFTFDELHCDVVGLCETKLDVSKYHVKKVVSTAIKSKFRSSKHAASTSPIPLETDYKPGGTMTLCFGPCVSRFHSKSEDSLGRWSTLSLNGRNGLVVHFVTVYQVVNKANGGPFTAYEQQRASLLLHNRDLLPRQAFLIDFGNYLLSLNPTSSQYVVMGDFNEVVGRQAQGFSKITTAFQLVDVLGHFHTLDNEVPTYARGTERLDYIFCSSSLIPAVKSCGAEPFNQHIFSDHRALFIDWHEDILFGSRNPPMMNHTQRRLQSKHRPSNTKYVDEFHKYCTDHNVTSRLQRLHEHPSERLAESIDRDVTRGMLLAESRCRNPGTDPWSPILQQARTLVEIYRHALSMVLIGLESRYKLSRLLDRYAVPVDVPDSRQDITIALRKARQELRKAQKEAAENRKSFLLKRACEAQMLQDSIPLKAAKQIAKAEEMKALHAKLRFISKDSDQQSGLTRLQVPSNPLQDPKQCTEWTTVDTPEEITTYLLERNRKHFGQADGTPFTVSPLSLQVNFEANTLECEAILMGAFETSDLDELTSLIVDFSKSVTEIDQLPSSITYKAMMDKYKFWPESTSTSPSGRHLGHYRALLPGPDRDNAASQALESRRSSLVSIHHSLLEYALENGHSFGRWKKVVNIMLEKEPGNPKIHRLRVIHLYEADYNLILGVKWRELVHHCEDNHLLHPSLYGARPGRGALEPVFVEEMVNEITRLSRKPVIKNAEDATACYDRIIPGVGNLASRSHGLHRTVAIVQGKTLSDVHYHLKTQLGVTEEFYQHCTISPIYGTGQGSGNSPTVWLVVSSILFKCYSKKANGARFESPDGSIRIDLYRVGFVDDTCSYVNKFLLDTPPTPDTMIQLLTHDSQLWCDLLWKSGGSLELPKCTYHFSNYKFASDGTPYLQHGRIGPVVSILHGDGESTQIVPFTSAFKAYKTLGCYKSPSGVQSTQLRVLRKNCDKHARIVSTSALSRQEAWTYYFSKYLTSPGYPLPVSHFTLAQLQQLERKVLPALFARCGFNRNTSRNVLFGPIRLGGAGFRPFSTEQGVGQLQFFVKHWTHPLEPGQLLRVAVAWAQINVGVGYSIFHNPVPSLPHFESKWLNSLRHFLRLLQGRLRLDVTFVPEIQRVNDTYIMDHVLERGLFTKREICRINYCRLYLQAVTVSDISTASGTHLANGIRQGKPTVWSGTTRYHKTNQQCPDNATWRLWSRAMNLVSDTSDALIVPLHQWIVPPSQQRRLWPVYYDPLEDALFFRTLTQYDRHDNINHHFLYQKTTTTNSLPESAYPVTIQEHALGWKIPLFSSYCPLLPSAPPSSFTSFCSLLEDWEAEILSNVTLLYHPFALVSLLENSSFYACSDGSAVAFEGTYGWSLCLENGLRLAYGSGPVDGHDPRSFRAEGQGMLSVVCFLRRLTQWTCSRETFKGTLATDNTGLIARIESQRSLLYPIPNSTFKPDWDVVQAVVQTLSSFQVEATFQHVKGHQDKDIQFDQLSILAQLNVEADKHAGAYRNQRGQYRPVIPLSPTRPVALDIDGRTIHRGFKQAIRDAIHAPHLLEAMQIRYDWPDGTLEVIDWEAHRQALQTHPTRRTHFVKLCHNILPTGSVVCTYGQGLPSYCALCKSPEEDFVHILRCPHHSRADWRTEFVTKIRKKSHGLATDPYLIDILIGGIESWFRNEPCDIPDLPRDYQQLLDEQNRIGWVHLFQGRISKSWQRLQQYHYLGLKPVKGRDGMSWSRGILSFVFTEWVILWEARNKTVHGNDNSTRAQSKRSQAIRELEILYSHRHNVLQRDRSLFYDDLEVHLDQPTRSIRQWLNSYKDLLLHSLKEAKIKSLIHVRPITKYFGAA